MRQGRLGVVLAWALTLLLLSVPGRAQETRAAKPELEEKAMAVLKRTTAVLSQAPRFSVTLDIGFDAVQDSGRKSNSAKRARSYCAARIVSASTPPNATGQRARYSSTGKILRILHPQENVYATAARPGSVDEAIAYLSMTSTCACRWPRC